MIKPSFVQLLGESAVECQHDQFYFSEVKLATNLNTVPPVVISNETRLLAREIFIFTAPRMGRLYKISAQKKTGLVKLANPLALAERATKENVLKDKTR